MSPPGVDVFVPCYNYGRYLRECVQSILEETELPIRVLIIDDASTDGSAEEARRIAAEDDRVTVSLHPANKGHIATYNEGIAWVEQAYCLLLSADDMVAPGALARAVALMETHPDVAFVYGRSIQFRRNEDLSREPEPAGAPTEISSGLEFVKAICARPSNPVEAATAVVRTTVQKRVGGYCPALPHSGDLEMWLRCAAQGDVGVIAAVQGYVRIHDNNMRHGYSGARFLQDFGQRRDAFDRFFGHHLADHPDAGRLHAAALGSLASELLWEASKAVEARRSCADLITFAEKLWPAVRRTAQYRKLLIKRRLQPLLELVSPRGSAPVGARAPR